VRRLVVFALAAALALTACNNRSSSALPSLTSLNVTGAGKIDHIVYVVQENRSFNNLFQGYPGAYTVTSGKDSRGKTIKLRPVSLSALPYDIDHSATAMFAACHGTGKLPGTKCRMDGFNKEATFNGPVPHSMYVYVPHGDSKPYFEMAHEWVLADRMFQSQLDESFVGHQYIIAAQAQSSVDLPFGLWGCPGGASDEVATITAERGYGSYQVPCFNYQTLGDELDKAKLSWRFYTSKYGVSSSDGGSWWSSYQAIRHIYYGPDWKKDIVTPQKTF
jgi:phospholipase C